MFLNEQEEGVHPCAQEAYPVRPQSPELFMFQTPMFPWLSFFSSSSHGENQETSQFISIQSLSRVQTFAIPWTAALQASLSSTNSWSLLKFMSIESRMPSNHLILCCLLFLLVEGNHFIKNSTRINKVREVQFRQNLNLLVGIISVLRMIL